MTNEERKAALEAIIYAADEPATIEQLASTLGEQRIVVQTSLEELIASYASDERGIEVRAVAGGYKMYTKPQHHDVVRRFIKSLRPPLRLSMPALETLAVIAYKQPVTGPEISEIRGVNSSGVLATLLDKHLITTAGRKEVMGRPILYKSSKEFLMRFGLSDLQELPSLKEFEALAREALGTDMGMAPTTEEEMLAGRTADTLENLTAQNQSNGAHADASQAESDTEGSPPSPCEASRSSSNAGAPAAGFAPGSSPSDAEFLREEEVTATAEGMPSGELDEEPPKAEAASTGE
jgi:segregation and condensation protein B